MFVRLFKRICQSLAVLAAMSSGPNLKYKFSNFINKSQVRASLLIFIVSQQIPRRKHLKLEKIAFPDYTRPFLGPSKYLLLFVFQKSFVRNVELYPMLLQFYCFTICFTTYYL